MPKKLLSSNGARLGTKVSCGLREQTAALIDTGCGIGNLRAAVEAITDKPVVVISTHTHPDYLGSNSQFDKIAMLERPLSHRVSENGISHQILEREILALVEASCASIRHRSAQHHLRSGERCISQEL